jgi:Ca-activated chloride channel homolog
VIPVCIVLYWFWQRWQKKQQQKLGDVHLVTNLIATSTTSSQKRNIFIAFLVSILLLMITMASLQVSGGTQKETMQSKEIMIAMDVSNSMLAADAMPNRLQKAKMFINQIIASNSTDKIGLILFAGNAYIAVPLTIDHAVIKMNVEATQPNALPTQGTNISEAITKALHCFDTKQEAGRAIIIVTDGEDHEQEIDAAIDRCKDNKIAIATVGVGTAKGATFIDDNTQQPKQDENGQTVVSRLNETELQAIASQANGIYIALDNSNNALLGLNSFLKNIAATASSIDVQKNIYYFQWTLLPAILLLLIALFYPAKQKKLVVMCIILLPNITTAQISAESIAQGNQKYKNQQYNQAILSYKKVIDNATNSIIHQSIANYNLGNAMAKQNNWQEAIDAYTKSLALQPSNADAKYNLCYAKSKLAKQSKPKNQQQQKKENGFTPENNKENQPKENLQNANKQSAKPQGSKLTKQQAEQYLQALQQEEKRLLQQKKEGKQLGLQHKKDW